MDCSRSTRQIPTSSRSAFKRLGTDTAQMTVATSSVVKHLHVIEYIGPGQLQSFVDAFTDSFFLQTTQGGFRFVYRTGSGPKVVACT